METARKKAQKALGKHSAVVETEGTVQNFQLAIAKDCQRKWEALISLGFHMLSGKLIIKNIIQSKLLNGLHWPCIYKITIAQSFNVTTGRNFMGYPHYGIKA